MRVSDLPVYGVDSRGKMEVSHVYIALDNLVLVGLSNHNSINSGGGMHREFVLRRAEN